MLSDTQKNQRDMQQQQLVSKLAGPLGQFLPEQMIYAAGGIARRITAFTPIVVVWLMIKQALSPDKSCRNALSELQAVRAELGLDSLSNDTGAYCKARQRLPENLLPDLTRQVAEQACNEDNPKSLWHDRRVIAVDGSSFNMPDTDKNQQDYPQHVGQKEGCGFPLASFVAAACLATGVILNAALGTFSCHDLTLFYHIRDCLVSGDIFLADRGFCAYMEIALLQEQGVDSVVRLHASRHKNERVFTQRYIRLLPETWRKQRGQSSLATNAR
jgi:hypothetical protein